MAGAGVGCGLRLATGVARGWELDPAWGVGDLEMVGRAEGFKLEIWSFTAVLYLITTKNRDRTNPDEPPFEYLAPPCIGY